MSEWISVKDQLPENNQFVLAVKEDSYLPVVLRFNCGPLSKNGYLFMWPTMQGQITNISHWMPLPELPKGIENDK